VQHHGTGVVVLLFENLQSLPPWAITLIAMTSIGAVSTTRALRIVFPQQSKDRAKIWTDFLALVSEWMRARIEDRRSARRRRERRRRRD
jgi:hypothetical protein